VLSRDYQTDPVRHEADAVEPETIDARHHFWLVDHHDRVEHTADLIETVGSSIVFTRTRHGADRLAKQLSRLGIKAETMHGGRSQNQRRRSLAAFTSGNAQALVATDVAARGIHIDDVASVIHYDPPGDHKDYLHRSGRTARAGASGTVVSLVTGSQRRTVQRMQRELDLHAPIAPPQLDAIHNGGHRIGDRPAGTPTHQPKPSRQRSERPKKQSKGSRSTSVYVANLPWSATSDQVADLFGRYGKVHEATVIADKRTGRSRGFGFVDMTKADAQSAIQHLNGSTFGGRDLTVRVAKPSRYVN